MRSIQLYQGFLVKLQPENLAIISQLYQDVKFAEGHPDILRSYRD